eukprot:scaffold1956_cov109-Cylindrotheca_fusiformis.AAC.4
MEELQSNTVTATVASAGLGVVQQPQEEAPQVEGLDDDCRVYFRETLVGPMIEALNPSITVDQKTRLSELYYQKLSLEDKLELSRQLKNATTKDPTQFEDFIKNERPLKPAERRRILASCLKDMFETSGDNVLVGKWYEFRTLKELISVSVITELANELSLFPNSEAFRFLQPYPFKSQDVLACIRNPRHSFRDMGMGDMGFCNEGSGTRYYSHTVRSERRGEHFFLLAKHYIYVVRKPQLSSSRAVVPPFLSEEFSSTKPHVTELLSPDMLELVNPWYSKEIENLFFPLSEETAMEAVQKQMELLRVAINCDEAMKDLVLDLDEDLILWEEYKKGIMSSDSLIIPRYITKLQRASIHIFSALRLMLSVDWRKQRLDWQACCAKAVQDLARIGLAIYDDAEPVIQWYEEFREQRKFENKILIEST